MKKMPDIQNHRLRSPRENRLFVLRIGLILMVVAGAIVALRYVAAKVAPPPSAIQFDSHPLVNMDAATIDSVDVLADFVIDPTVRGIPANPTYNAYIARVSNGSELIYTAKKLEIDPNILHYYNEFESTAVPAVTPDAKNGGYDFFPYAYLEVDGTKLPANFTIPFGMTAWIEVSNNKNTFVIMLTGANNQTFSRTDLPVGYTIKKLIIAPYSADYLKNKKQPTNSWGPSGSYWLLNSSGLALFNEVWKAFNSTAVVDLNFSDFIGSPSTRTSAARQVDRLGSDYVVVD